MTIGFSLFAIALGSILKFAVPPRWQASASLPSG